MHEIWIYQQQAGFAALAQPSRLIFTQELTDWSPAPMIEGDSAWVPPAVVAVASTNWMSPQAEAGDPPLPEIDADREFVAPLVGSNSWTSAMPDPELPAADLVDGAVFPFPPIAYGVYTSIGVPFLYTAANWDNVEFHFETYMRATAGTVNARLYNETDATAVVGSDLATSSATLIRQRSAALTLVDGKEYRAQTSLSAGSAGRRMGAKLIATPA